MTAPAARTLAEIVAEGRRLDEEIQSAIDMRLSKLADESIDRRNEFRVEHWPTLLAVAEAAVEWEEAEDAYDHSFDPTPDLVIWRVNASLALRAAVRGEERPDE